MKNRKQRRKHLQDSYDRVHDNPSTHSQRPSLPLQLQPDLQPQITAEEQIRLDAHLKAIEELVFHYTSASALLNIVTKRVLWLTSIEFMNDMWEFQLPRRRLMNFTTHPSAWVPTSTPRSHLEALQLHLGNSVVSYAACFSRARDSLSQFRLYGQGGGYSIGFQRSFLGRLAMSISDGDVPTKGVAAVVDVNYSHEALESWCEQYASTFLYEAERIDAAHQLSAQEIWNQIYGTLPMYDQRLFAQMLYKSKQFAVEEEVRLFKFGFGRNAKRCWRPSRGGNYIVPYIEVRVPNEPVVVMLQRGPNLDDDLAQKTINEAMMAARDAGTQWLFSVTGGHDSGFRMGL